MGLGTGRPHLLLLGSATRTFWPQGLSCLQGFSHQLLVHTTSSSTLFPRLPPCPLGLDQQESLKEVPELPVLQSPSLPHLLLNLIPAAALRQDTCGSPELKPSGQFSPLGFTGMGWSVPPLGTSSYLACSLPCPSYSFCSQRESEARSSAPSPCEIPPPRTPPSTTSAMAP